MFIKRTSFALILVFVFLVSLLSNTKLVQVAYAQFEGLPYDPPIVTIMSPSMNKAYNVPDVPVNVTVQIRGFIYKNIERIRWLNYSLDGQTAIPMTLTVPSDLSPGYYVYGNDVLTGVSDGTHNLTIYGETYVGDLTGNFNATVTFRMDTSTTATTEPFPTIRVATALSLAAVAGIALILHFKKRNRKT